MVDINALLQIFIFAAIIGVIIEFFVKLLIQALFFRIFTKKYDLPRSFWKAYFAVFFPYLIITLLGIPVVFMNLGDILLICTYILFLPLLIVSTKLVYQTNWNISTLVSLKYFLLGIGLIIIVAGVMTLLGASTNNLGSNVPQPVCSVDCRFAYSIPRPGSVLVENGSLKVTGYNIPSGKYQQRSNYIIAKQTFTEQEITTFKTNQFDINGNPRIQGKLDAGNCNYMEFTREHGGTNGGTCEGESTNFLTNLKNILS